MKQCAILLPVFSLPSETGIGCFSKEAFGFIDFLKASGQDAWQILPIGLIDKWHSPYQPCSIFAGEPMYIDPEALASDGLLTEEELTEYKKNLPPDTKRRVDYDALIPAKDALLRQAFARFAGAGPAGHEAFDAFRAENAFWLDDYCLFMVLTKFFKGTAESWTQWDAPLRDRNEKTLAEYREKHKDEILYLSWQQYVFFSQWEKLRRHAHESGIRIIGDMPFYMTLESVDCWTHPELFQLDQDRQPTAVSGVPGDGFDKNGQLWNSPLYDWDNKKEELYDWWTLRLARGFLQYDVIRLDHVRAFASYFSIPADDKLVRNGVWKPGPGADIFAYFKTRLENSSLIAEDLGHITKDVREMLREAGLPGMKVLQFAFDSGRRNPYRPEHITENAVIYTGTHDNDTTAGWYEGLGGLKKFRADRCLRRAGKDSSPVKRMIATAMRTKAELCVIPLQDYLELGSDARVNTPGTTEGNWQWRLDASLLNNELAFAIRKASRRN